MTKSLLIPLLFLLTSCDAFKGDDVFIEYLLYSASGDSVADVLYLDKNGNEVRERNVQTGWSYSFKAEEGSQLLYVFLSNVKHSGMIARIKVGGKIISDTGAGEMQSAGISAWGPDENIKIYYTAVSGHDGFAIFNTPQGLDSLTVSAFEVREGPTSVTRREYTVNAGFESAIVIDGAGIFAGDPCLRATIEYEPVEGNRLTLISKSVCDISSARLNTSEKIPGYQLVPR